MARNSKGRCEGKKKWKGKVYFLFVEKYCLMVTINLDNKKHENVRYEY